MGHGRFFQKCRVVVGVLLAATSTATAQEDEEKPIVPRDRSSHARSGEAIEFFDAPAAQELACAPRHGICVAVEAGSQVPEARRLEALRSADETYGLFVETLGFKGPLPVREDPHFHIVLRDRGSAQSSESGAIPVRRDPRTRIDAVESVGVVDARVSGCVLEANVARAIAEGIAWRVRPGEDHGSRAGMIASLVTLAVPCAAPLQAPAIADYQARANDPIIAAPRPDDAGPIVDQASGTTLFFDWLDGTLGARPGSALLGMWASAATRTPVNARQWVGEPDTFDVLAVSGKGAFGTNSDLGDLFLHFGADRLFFARAPSRFPWAGGYRAATAIAFDREIPWPDQPRRFLHRRPVSHSGVTSLAVDLAGRTGQKRLRAEITWEDFAHFRFEWVTVAADGHPIATYAMAGEARGTAANGTLVNLDGAAKVVLLGTSDGDPRFPFDPDDQVWEPHGFEIVIAAVD